MFRRLSPCLVLIALVAAAVSPRAASASGAWSTYIRMKTCNDMLALRDTVWMASGEAGIVRYLRSANRFESVTREPNRLASNAITALTFDRSGRLWAGTAGRGVSRLEANGLSWALVNAFDGVPSDTATVLRADGDTIWIGTTRGIALWNGREIAGKVPDRGTPSPFRSDVVTGIVVLGDSLLVSTTDGIYVARLSQHLEPWHDADGGLTDTNVQALACDGRDVLALSAGKVDRLDRTSGTWVPATPTGVILRLGDRGGTMQCSTRDSLSTWSGGGWHALAGAPLPNPVTGIATAFTTSPDGHVFTVVLRSGAEGVLHEHTGTSWVQRTIPGPVGNDVNNILADGSGAWVATDAEGMARFDGTTWTNYVQSPGPSQNATFMSPLYAFTLQRDSQGYLWTSHWNSGIERIDTRTEPYYFLHAFSWWNLDQADARARHTNGWSSAADSSGYVYIGGDTPRIGDWEPMGIDVYDPAGAPIANWTATSARLGSNQVRAIAFDRLNGQLWAGFASKGVGYVALSALDSDNLASNGNDHLRIPTFISISSLGNQNVFGVVAHGDSIWVLTATQLYRLKGSTHGVQSTLDIIAQAAPRGAVHPLEVAADGTVWTASVVGVRRFRPGGGHDDFNIDNSPLADNIVRSISIDRRTGVVWFGTSSGINRFDPHYAAPPAAKLPWLRVSVYPSPAKLNGLGASFHLKGNATQYEGEILDITGRVVRKFASSANDQVIWDGRDGDGGFVRSGIYFVHARSGGHEATTRVVVLR